MIDPYLDLGTGVLHNRLGITDPAELARVETDVSAIRLLQLSREPLPGRYDLDHLQDFHHFLFGDIYDWAGQLRTVTIAKGRMFCLPWDLDSAADELFDDLHRADLLRGRERDAFVTGLTDTLNRINYLHPFREGNGRTQRAFLAQLARDAGYALRWGQMGREENLDACRQAMDGDSSALHTMLARLVAPLPSPPPRRGRSDDS